jgi:hypothetical protein
MNLDGSKFTVYSPYQGNVGYFAETMLVANDSLGTFVIVPESDVSGISPAVTLKIFCADKSNQLQFLKQYYFQNGVGAGYAWAVDGRHFAIALGNPSWDHNAVVVMLFDKNGNVVKGL